MHPDPKVGKVSGLNPDAVTTQRLAFCRPLFFMFTVYILHSDFLNRYYIGYTADSPETRLRKHLANHKGFTSRTPDWKIVYTESFGNKEAALKREKQIKNWKSRKMIEKLIGSTE